MSNRIKKASQEIYQDQLKGLREEIVKLCKEEEMSYVERSNEPTFDDKLDALCLAVYESRFRLRHC